MEITFWWTAPIQESERALEVSSDPGIERGFGELGQGGQGLTGFMRFSNRLID